MNSLNIDIIPKVASYPLRERLIQMPELQKDVAYCVKSVFRGLRLNENSFP